MKISSLKKKTKRLVLVEGTALRLDPRSWHIFLFATAPDGRRLALFLDTHQRPATLVPVHRFFQEISSNLLYDTLP